MTREELEQVLDALKRALAVERLVDKSKRLEEGKQVVQPWSKLTLDLERAVHTVQYALMPFCKSATVPVPEGVVIT